MSHQTPLNLKEKLVILMFKYNNLSGFKYYNNGFQKKYIKDNFFYKLDESDNTSEAITEELVTKLLNFSSLNKYYKIHC